MSTSRTVALLWTIVIGYSLLTLVLIALGPVTDATPVPGSIPPGFIEAALKPIDVAYTALLFPIVALVAAKVIVTQGIANGSIQKTTADSTSVLDLVANDDGETDLADLQYLLFNVIAAIFVVTQFAEHPARGLPSIPLALSALIAASATVYTGNKAITKNPPSVQQVLSTQTMAGREVILLGRNLVVGNRPGSLTDSAEQTSIILTGTGMTSPPAVKANEAEPDRVSFTVPSGAETGVWDGTVLTNGGGRARFHGLQVTAIDPAGRTGASA